MTQVPIIEYDDVTDDTVKKIYKAGLQEQHALRLM